MSRDFVLGFDTATADTVVAVTRGGEVVGESTIGAAEAGPRHAVCLLPEVERLVSEAGGWERVERIGVGIGPGSYTGLRIGLATARALSQATTIPVVPISSLKALAQGLLSEHRLLLPLIDARRNETFVALYDSAGKELWQPFVATPEGLLERLSQLGQAPLAFGDGSLRFRDELEAGGVAVADQDDPRHRIQGRCACELAAAAEPAPLAAIEPAYLRQPDAERWHKRDDPGFR